MTGQYTKPTRWAIVALIAVLGLIGATACSSSSKDTGSPGQPTKPAVQTPWQLTLDKVKPDGSVDVSTALTAFALAIGPVPGVTPPAGSRDDITSGTIAIRWVTRVWSKLSNPQRQAIQDRLNGSPAPGSGSHSIRAQAAPPKLDPDSPNLPCQASDSATASAYRGIVDDAAAKIGARLGRTLPTPPVVLVDTATPAKLSDAYLYTYGCSGKVQTDSKGKGCTIHVTTGASQDPVDTPNTASALAHEVMHCFIDARLGAAAEARLPDWYGEGLPNWVASSIGAVGPIISSAWHAYLDRPARPLSQDTYAGIGFFAHLAESGTDPWGVIDKMGDAMAEGGGTARGWAAAGVNTNQEFLDSWGSGFAQERYPGTAWRTTAPNLDQYQPPITRENDLAN